MRLLTFIYIFMFTACTDAANKHSVKCNFSYSNNQLCEFKQSKVSLLLEPVAADEKRISEININRNKRIYKLQPAEEITLLTGDKGIVSVEDINFDGYEDLAISTSFGVANLYLDYWVYDKQTHHYRYIGNFSQFLLDKKSKILTSRIKHHAAKVENVRFRWDENKLMKIE